MSIFVMKILILITLILVQNVYGLHTIWESLEMSTSKTFYNILNEAKYQKIQTLFKSQEKNQTFFLPTESAVQSAIKNNLFSNDSTEESILYTTLPDLYNTATLGEKRLYLNTLSSLYPTIITSPKKATQDNLSFQVISGPVTANVINQTECSNGIIYTVDDFLVAPLNVLDTISYIPELESLENIIKSQNLSNIVDVTNSTIFAPVNAAWSSSTKLAYGTIVHSLKYEIINHVFTQQQLLSKNYTLTTNYLSNTIKTETFPNQTIFLVGGDSINSDGSIDVRTVTVATVIKTDILTASGTVIHLIDKILPADSTISETTVIHKLKAPAKLNHASSLSCSLSLMVFPVLLLHLFVK